jgi:hypothetical protein
MPTSDDERFEQLLKQFRPLIPDTLPTGGREHSSRSQLVNVRWVAAMGVLVIGIAAGWLLRPKQVPVQPKGPPEAVTTARTQQPLTIGSANDFITHSSSIKTALDELAFRSDSMQFSGNKQSALAVLSQEKNKL